MQFENIQDFVEGSFLPHTVDKPPNVNVIEKITATNHRQQTTQINSGHFFAQYQQQQYSTQRVKTTTKTELWTCILIIARFLKII